jgi:hypothetical protein
LGKFDVRPVRDVGGTAGNTGFRTALIGAVAITNFRDIVKVALVSDGDSHYGASFKNIIKQIERANQHPTVAHRYGVPTRPYKVAGGKPSVTVILLPGPTSPGALESLLWPALCSVAACKRATDSVEKACADLGITKGTKKWAHARQDKARVHASLALCHQKDPGITLNLLFGRAPKLIPLDHKCFDKLADAIKAL